MRRRSEDSTLSRALRCGLLSKTPRPFSVRRSSVSSKESFAVGGAWEVGWVVVVVVVAHTRACVVVVYANINVAGGGRDRCSYVLTSLIGSEMPNCFALRC